MVPPMMPLSEKTTSLCFRKVIWVLPKWVTKVLVLFWALEIFVSSNRGVKLTLKDVRLVPDLRLILLTIGKFDEEGYTSCFGEGCSKLTKGAFVQAKRRKCCTLYKTQLHL